MWEALLFINVCFVGSFYLPGPSLLSHRMKIFPEQDAEMFLHRVDWLHQGGAPLSVEPVVSCAQLEFNEIC